MTMLSAPSPSTWISMPRTESGLLIAAEILAAEGAEEIGDGGALRAQGLDAGDARGEEATLGIDDVELRGDAVLVAKASEAQGVGERLGALGFGLEALARAGLRSERGADLAERGLDGLLVLRDERALARLC